ncbi:uncharacterized protein LOC122036971 [Zingiber officinale]|uniref:uncharacterized protein LOC122036971 n=1 Tax=Zingiber officinale TaxID=94328 RepID=UPI001C4CF56E|nr:uncharacterized protein LOC122036971 [Zingiber officinale]
MEFLRRVGSLSQFSEPCRRAHRFGCSRRRRQQADAVGETLCCCCRPCALVNLVAVVTARLPALLVRKSLGQWRKLHRKKGAILLTGASAFKAGEGFSAHGAAGGGESVWQGRSPSAEEVPEVKKIKRASFYCAGFWRSPPAIIVKGGEA